MLKHIFGQAIFQLTVRVVLLFLGQRFIPEYKDDFDGEIGSDLAAKYYNGQAESTISDGKFYAISGE